MYTRSYRSGRAGSNILPPDYGGTALVINQPPKYEKENDDPGTISDKGMRDQFTGNSDREANKSDPDNRRYPRRITESNVPENEKSFVAPFGDYGQPDAENCCEAEENTRTKRLPDVKDLKTDDLLLLGLIFLMMTENGTSGTGREALLILAVLYLSGM